VLTPFYFEKGTGVIVLFVQIDTVVVKKSMQIKGLRRVAESGSGSPVSGCQI
jgi:hypothetical protein